MTLGCEPSCLRLRVRLWRGRVTGCDHTLDNLLISSWVFDIRALLIGRCFDSGLSGRGRLGLIRTIRTGRVRLPGTELSVTRAPLRFGLIGGLVAAFSGGDASGFSFGNRSA